MSFLLVLVKAQYQQESVFQCSIRVPLIPTTSYCTSHHRVISRQQGRADHAPNHDTQERNVSLHDLQGANRRIDVVWQINDLTHEHPGPQPRDGDGWLANGPPACKTFLKEMQHKQRETFIAHACSWSFLIHALDHPLNQIVHQHAKTVQFGHLRNPDPSSDRTFCE